MIASVTGTVAWVGAAHAVVEVSGFGVQVLATPELLSGLRVGASARLDTAWVHRKDEAPLLFGFASPAERDVFETMLGVSGIGPRTALAVLAVLSPQDVHRAIATGDVKALTAVPGIGPKGAKRILLELADKLVVDEPAPVAPVPAAQTEPWRTPVLEALQSLGWSEKDALRGMEDALVDQQELVERGSVPEILRTVLAWVGSTSGRATVGHPAGRTGKG